MIKLHKGKNIKKQYKHKIHVKYNKQKRSKSKLVHFTSYLTYCKRKYGKVYKLLICTNFYGRYCLQ